MSPPRSARPYPRSGHALPSPTVSTAQPDAARPLHALPDTGYVYRTGWRLTTSDIDEHRRVRLDGVARYIQEVGAEHLIDSGFADVNPHWIVQRTVIDV